MPNVKAIDLALRDVAAKIAYDPLTGRFTWKVAPSRRIHAGESAGQIKSTRTGGVGPKYLYICLNGVQTPATRVAWMLTYGEWPMTNVLFRDGDSLNLRIDNLKLADYPSTVIVKEGRRIYKTDTQASRAWARRYRYNVEPEHYAEMLAEQNSVCAICGQPETAVLNGVVKEMHVDHCHTTDAVRALLCGMCNGMLGLAKDSPETLRAAADYIELHAARIESLQSFDILLEEMN